MNYSIIVWDWLGTLVQDSAPVERAQKLLNAFHEKNITQIILTNGYSNNVSPILENWNWAQWVSVVVGRESGYLKPDPQALINALNKINCTPGPHVLLIGDSASDRQCALRAGCHWKSPDDKYLHHIVSRETYI